MLRNVKMFSYLANLGAWLIVALLAVVALLFYTNLASAQQTSTAKTPSTPTLTAQVSEGAVELSWTAVIGATRYELWAWESVDGWQQIGGDSLTDTTYTHTDVTAGPTYHYTVRAVSPSGATSAWADYVSTTVPAASDSESTLPAPALTAQATESAVKLSWTDVTGAARYELWAWESVDGWEQIGGDSLTGTTYTHTGVTAGATYHYAVRALDTAGEASDWSVYESVTIAANGQGAQSRQVQQHTATPTTSPTAAPTAVTDAATATATSTPVLVAGQQQVVPIPTATATSTPTLVTGQQQLVLIPTATATSTPILVTEQQQLVLIPTATATSTPILITEQQQGNDATVTPTAAATSVDRAVLVAIYEATGGGNWTRNLDWLSDRPISVWQNVYTDANGRVTRLHLENNGMVGSLPARIRDLTELQHLNLGRNRLNGPIPGAISSLSKLTHLNLSSNSFSGGIPPRLGDLTKVTYFNLSTNNLSGTIPSRLGDLAKVKTLDLSQNAGLTGSIPGSFNQLTALENLELMRNNLSGSLPGFLSQLTNLKHISLSSNNFSGSIPGSWSSLVNLETLILNNMSLSGPIPIQLGQLSNLVHLNLNNNNLNGSIPTGLDRLSKLKHLSLEKNGLTGAIPGSLGSLSNLQYLWLADNALTGTIPGSFDKLSKLRQLNLKNNLLDGDIPAFLGDLSQLQTLLLSGNNFSGCIPRNILEIPSGQLQHDLLRYEGQVQKPIEPLTICNR